MSLFCFVVRSIFYTNRNTFPTRKFSMTMIFKKFEVPAYIIHEKKTIFLYIFHTLIYIFLILISVIEYNIVDGINQKRNSNLILMVR